MRYIKEEFELLDIDSRCLYIEHIIPNDYYNGQLEIDFWIPPGFTGENGENLPPTPPEIAEVEEMKFIELVNKLGDKIFSIYSAVIDKGDGKVWGELIENHEIILLYDENEPIGF